tara:strand:+ start:376 stop:1017 length:642 start_codon:yes stop_codon:yes gene_type:complete
LKALAVKVDTFERGAFIVGDALKVKIPQDVAHWRHRSNAGETIKEGDIFADLAALCSLSANALIQYRNVATTFPKDVRVTGVSFGAHKYLAKLASANDGARRSAIVEWMATNMPTAAEAQDHAKAMRLADSPPTDPPADGGPAPLSAADADGPAVTTIDGNGLVAAIFAACDSHDGSDADEMKAAVRCIAMAADALGVTVTEWQRPTSVKEDA